MTASHIHKNRGNDVVISSVFPYLISHGVVFLLCGSRSVLLHIHTVKATVIYISDPRRSTCGRHALADELACGGKLFSKDILLR